MILFVGVTHFISIPYNNIYSLNTEYVLNIGIYIYILF